MFRNVVERKENSNELEYIWPRFEPGIFQTLYRSVKQHVTMDFKKFTKD